MNLVAETKSVKMSPRKVRLVADAIRNLSVDEAIIALTVVDKRAAGTLMKTLQSAIANAVNNGQFSRDNLKIAQIIVNEGQAMKRFHPSTRGRIHPYKRRTTHVRIVLEEKSKTATAIQPTKMIVKETKGDEAR